MRKITVLTAMLTLGLFGGINSCTTDYVTGKRTFSLVSESQEIAMGREADPQIIAEYGLYDDPTISAYVSQLGTRLSKRSQRSQLDYTFRVVDSPIINAFALPGGYVYITRGIMAHFNSEDELAGVMGHEIGHVVARHGAEQMSRQQLAGLGLGLGSLLSERFRDFADAAGMGVSLLFLKFSREQESEADLLGVEYSTELGYNAHRMAAFFETLKRQSEGSGQALPSFLSTHPDPGDREVRVNALADEWQKKVNYSALNTNPADYLKRLEGMVYGNDPRQGYVENQMFYHPTLRFQFPVPASWQVANTPAMVQMISDDKTAAIQLSSRSGDSPRQAADDFISKNQASVRRQQSSTVHGYAAHIVESDIATDSGTLRVLSYFIAKGGAVYVFHGFTTAEAYGTFASTFTRVMEGFEDVTSAAVLNKKPRRVRVRQATASGDFASVAKGMGTAETMLAEIALLNGRQTGDRVAKGDWLKLVEE